MRLQLPFWIKASKQQHIMLPKFLDLNWNAHTKTGSEFVDAMSVPTCSVGLTYQEQATRQDQIPTSKTLQFELSKGKDMNLILTHTMISHMLICYTFYSCFNDIETLDTMLDNMRKIKEQLTLIVPAASINNNNINTSSAGDINYTPKE